MASTGQFPRVILFAAVAAAVAAGTLPALLKQVESADDATDRGVVASLLVNPAPAPTPAPPTATASEPVFMPAPVKVALVTAILDAPARAAVAPGPPPAAAPQAETPPATPVVAAPAPVSFPPVQPMDLEAADKVADNLRPSVVQTAPPPDAPNTVVIAPSADAPSTRIVAPPPAAAKHVRRVRVAHHRYTRQRHVRPAPFSIRRFFASLRTR